MHIYSLRDNPSKDKSKLWRASKTFQVSWTDVYLMGCDESINRFRLPHIRRSSTIYVLQDYAGAFNNTCFTKEENAVNIMERIAMLLTGECYDDVWLTKLGKCWNNFVKSANRTNRAGNSTFREHVGGKRDDENNELLKNFHHVNGWELLSSLKLSAH